MAKNAKPNDDYLGSEISVSIGEYDNLYVKNSPYGLFDGDYSNGFSSPQTVYWYDKNAYITITVNDFCNIWRHPASDYPQHCGKFKIEKLEYNAVLDKNEFVDVTSNIQQTTTQTKDWEKTITQLEPGTYKFSLLNKSIYRLDDEWYVEQYTLNEEETHEFRFSFVSKNNFIHMMVPILKNAMPTEYSSEQIDNAFSTIWGDEA